MYFVGLLAYFAAWVAVMLAPDSAWSRSAVGSLAPAWAAYPWLVGIGLMSRKLYFSSPYRWWMYVCVATAFIGFHIAHFAIE